jgi:hypothetical protein
MAQETERRNPNLKWKRLVVESSERSSLRVAGNVRLMVGSPAIVRNSLFLHPRGRCDFASLLKPRQITQSGIGSRPRTHLVQLFFSFLSVELFSGFNGSLCL